ncbi:MAG: pentapeptide repeat-containing protein [Bacteroidota bacterium]
MAYTDTESTKEELLKKVEELEARLAAYENSREKVRKTQSFIVRKLGGFFLLGPKLKNSLNKIQEGDLSKDNISEVIIAVLYRFTRIGVFALIVALVPIALLYQQNRLISQQNEKFDLQNRLFEYQDTLVESQNRKLEVQTHLLRSQDEKFGKQNEMFDLQTKLIAEQTNLFRYQNQLVNRQTTLLDTQNYRLNIQNNLIEADRRSSLVFLMSNVLDRVDEEIKEQRIAISKDSGDIPANMRYGLSKPLISRIVALSRAFMPYKIMTGDILSEKLSSPERGQLFIALMESNLNNTTHNILAEQGDFSYSIIGRVKLDSFNLANANFQNVNLSEADLRNTNLNKANFWNANLSYVIFHEANLINANLVDANLIGADMHDSKLFRAYLAGANLNSADLSGSDLRESILNNANLSNVNLQRAYLGGAQLYGVKMDGVDLNGVYNLELQQLLSTSSLYNCKGLSENLEKELKKLKPCLFTSKGC